VGGDAGSALRSLERGDDGGGNARAISEKLEGITAENGLILHPEAYQATAAVTL